MSNTLGLLLNISISDTGSDFFSFEQKSRSGTNSELRDSELSMPKILYNSDTYIDHPELRGPMEELILGYEKERVKHGLSKKTIVGDG